MPRFQYSPLQLKSQEIRLLRLFPHEDRTADIQCQLFDYSLHDSATRMHHYNALSYVWGDENNRPSIYINLGKLNGGELHVTKNLHAALLRLRDSSLERIIWVDAICINQNKTDTKEKEDQIQLMAKIYRQASRVLVWLGEAADNSDQALEEIRAAGAAGRKATTSANNKIISSAVLKLLQRTWFQRIWILQEVAAARHVLIMCGPAEIDGYAFYLGIESLSGCFGAHKGLQSLIRSVTYLIRGSIFRTGGLTQAIGPLSELIDMYHSHEATLPHDKVYALLGMNSTGLENADLQPDYTLPWEELFQRLTRFLLGDQVSTNIGSKKEIFVIEGKGCILGRISSVQNPTSSDGRQGVDIILRDLPGQQRHTDRETHWKLHYTVQPIQIGDLICLLEGASNPTVIRSRKDHFIIIMIIASPLENGRKESEVQGPELFDRDFILVWDWKNSRTSQYMEEDANALVPKNEWVLEYSKMEVTDDLKKAARMWNVIVILDDVEEYEKAEEGLSEVVSKLKTAFGKKHLELPKGRFGRTPLSWAVKNGHEAVVRLLIEKGADVDKQDDSGRTSLSWAAENGHETIIRLLLENGADTDSQDINGLTSLSWAARNGHEVILRLLLEKGASIDGRGQNGNRQAPLSWAAGKGHEAVVRLLLEKGASINERDHDYYYHRAPLPWAAKNGHETIVRLLLETGADVDKRDHSDRTSLIRAAENGHEAVVRLLLEKGADINERDKKFFDRTSLSWAAGNGHESIVRLLLENGAIDNLGDYRGRTPLERAAENEHEGIVKLLSGNN